MKHALRFALIVALSTLAVLMAIPTAANAQIIPNWQHVTVSPANAAPPPAPSPMWKRPPFRYGGTPLPPPDLGDPNPKPPRCGWTFFGYRCST